jgi:hypothetical protein
VKKRTPLPGLSKDDVAAIYGSDRELERIQSAARNRDKLQPGETNQKIREVFKKTPHERVLDDSRITPRPGNTAREGMLLAGTRTPPKRIRDRLPIDSGFKSVTHGIDTPTKGGLEVAKIMRESLSEFEESEYAKTRHSESKWDNVPRC